jgi:hypothetical protein
VIVLAHARDRMRERGVSFKRVTACLQKGEITEGPAPDPNGLWKCRVERMAAGDRLAVVVVIDPPRLLVVTIFEIGR